MKNLAGVSSHITNEPAHDHPWSTMIQTICADHEKAAAVPTITVASYNITNDKLKFWADRRLSDVEYAQAKNARFTYWHGSKCFVAKWSPEADDLVLRWGRQSDPEFTIEQDDEADDVEGRVDRFAKYAAAASMESNSTQEYLDGGRANTERRQRLAAARIEKSLSEEAHWNERIQASIRHAARKDRPDVVKRRIDGLESDRRKMEARFTVNTSVDGALYQNPNAVWVGKGRGGHWIKNEVLASTKAHSERWIAHIDQRLAYEKALLAAVGGTPTDKWVFQVGGSVAIRLHVTESEYVRIVRVNRSSAFGKVTGLTLEKAPAGHWTSKVRIEDVADYTPPAAEDIKEAKAAKKLPPLVNYPGESFRHVTKAEYDRKAMYQSAWARKEPATAEHGAHRQRVLSFSIMEGCKPVFITDLPTKERPAAEKE